MVHITIYQPYSDAPFEYDVESYGIREHGVLWFRIPGTVATDVTTTVPFMIRQQVEEKEKPPARRNAPVSGSAWS